MNRALFACLLCLIPFAAHPRLIRTPTDQEMFDQADAVVIAVAGVGRDTDEKTTLAGIEPGIRVVGVTTELKVKAWLKGEPRAPGIVLHHYRTESPGQMLLNGPLLLDFHTADARTYLMYLIREPDGRYAPVAGQTDPAGFSVQRIAREL